MKVGNQVGGMTVIDIKRVNKMNIIQFTKAVSEYIDQGYKIDVNSSRAIGLVLQVDMFKLESSSNTGSTESTNITEDDAVKIEVPNEEKFVLTVNGVEVEGVVELDEITVTSDEERLAKLDKDVEEAKAALDTFTTPEQNDVAVQKKTRAKKTT